MAHIQTKPIERVLCKGIGFVSAHEMKNILTHFIHVPVVMSVAPLHPVRSVLSNEDMTWRDSSRLVTVLEHTCPVCLLPQTAVTTIVTLQDGTFSAGVATVRSGYLEVPV